MNDEVNKKLDNHAHSRKNYIMWGAIFAVFILGIVYVRQLIFALNNDDKFIAIIYEHLSAVIGIPGAIVTAFVIVIVLEQVSGTIKFEAPGFIFEGASGPIIMWVIVFFTLVSGINILW